GGWVCSEPFDHTSVLRFVERVTGVRAPNVTDWRRKTFGDLTSAFRFDESAAGPTVLPDTAGPLTQARYEATSLPLPTLPSGQSQRMPAQERGGRKRVPRKS